MVIKLAIVDDRVQVRNTIQSRIEYTNEIKTIFTAINGQDFLEQVKNLNPNVRPDVVLMDIDMPELNGIQAVERASVLYPDMKFIMLTVFDDEEKIFNAIKAGANGYLLKDENIDEIIDYIKLVSENKGAVMSPAIARKALDMLVNNQKNTKDKANATITEETNLSQREISVLKGLVDGLDHKSIAQKLDLSPATVRTHMINIYRKLHVSSKTQAVGLALKKKWF
ncbi:MAG: response regulator transcription factor [Bacteroidia bacterium]|nr:response regulator transcription factor [Bacteroidia bacterium]